MKPRWVIARKEFAGVFTERTILLAVVIQVFVAGFSSFLVVGLSALVDPQAFPSAARTEVVLNPAAWNDPDLMAQIREANIDTRNAGSDNETW
ncbi:MAG TPA: ABC transporter permease, partial [Candidatus Thermoplasmatota archaeon]|nr:ABC transporter permease [Candidatus Thermoplasmatota archaeon]